MAAWPACRASVCEPEEGAVAAVITATSCWAVSLPLSGGVGLEAAGLPAEVAGGGEVGIDLVGAGASGASFAGAELAGSEESGAALEGEESAGASFFFFIGAVGT
jgi:hypothetical protein